jgi:hypothetical protein
MLSGGASVVWVQFAGRGIVTSFSGCASKAAHFGSGQDGTKTNRIKASTPATTSRPRRLRVQLPPTSHPASLASLSPRLLWPRRTLASKLGEGARAAWNDRARGGAARLCYRLEAGLRRTRKVYFPGARHRIPGQQRTESIRTTWTQRVFKTRGESRPRHQGCEPRWSSGREL